MGWAALGVPTEALRAPNMEAKDLARAIKFAKKHRAVTFFFLFPLFGKEGGVKQKMLQRAASSEMLKIAPSPSLPCLAFEAHRWTHRGPPNPTSVPSNIVGSWVVGWEAREEREEGRGREEREERGKSEKRGKRGKRGKCLVNPGIS